MRRLQQLISLIGLMLLVIGSGCVNAPAAPMNSVGDMVDGQLPSTWINLSAQVERVVVPETLRRAEDFCDNATSFEDTDGNALDIVNMIASGQTIMNEFPPMTSSDDDPPLCYDGVIPLDSFGSPATNLAGYRTGWYQLRAPANGILHIEAAPNFSYEDNFDTIIAVHEGVECGSFTRSYCSDDDNGLLTNLSVAVEEGEFYTIEIADRNLAVNGRAVLNLQVYLEPTGDAVKREGDWTSDLSNRSRHAAVAVGENIYVIGGQTVVDDNTPVRTGSVGRFNTVTKAWTEMSSMPSECAGDGNGYSNNDVAVYNEFIMFPSGYVGDSALNSGVHCIYNTLLDEWIVGEEPLEWRFDPVSYAAVISAPGLDGYFIIGGLNGPFRQSLLTTQDRGEVYFYSTNGGYWDYSIPSIDSRYGHTGAVLDDRYLCIAGGLRTDDDNNPLPLRGIQCLDFFDTTVPQQWHEIGNMKVPRNLAGSVVKDNVWYIYGGYEGFGTDPNPVAIIETVRIDSAEPQILPGSDTTPSELWKAQFSFEQLDQQYNIDEPVRGWVRGDFVGDTLYLIGGETSTGGDIRVINVVEAVRFDEEQLFLPLINTGDIRRDDNGEPNDSPIVAQPIKPGQTYTGNFNELGDLVDVYSFNPFANTIRFVLSDIPTGENYDLYIYDTQKRLVASSTTGGSFEEDLTVALEGGNHYVMVVLEGSNRINVTGTYKLKVEEVE